VVILDNDSKYILMGYINMYICVPWVKIRGKNNLGIVGLVKVKIRGKNKLGIVGLVKVIMVHIKHT